MVPYWRYPSLFSEQTHSTLIVCTSTGAVKNKDDNNSHILTHDGHISPTIIPTSHVGNESGESWLHKVFVSCELHRGKDSGELPALFRDNLINGIYGDLPATRRPHRCINYKNRVTRPMIVVDHHTRSNIPLVFIRIQQNL